MKSLSKKIALYIGGLFLVMCIIIGTFTMFMTQLVMKRECDKSLLTITNLAADKIEVTIAAKLNILQEIADRSQVKDMKLKEQKENLKKEIKELGYLDMAVVKPNGQAQYMLADKVEDLSSREYVKKALAGEKNISDLLISKVTGEPVIMYSVPVYDENKKVIAALVARRSGEALSLVTDSLKYGKTGYAYILNEKGNIIAHKNRDYVYQQFNPIEAAKTDDIFRSAGTTIKSMLSQGQGISQYSLKGKTIYNAYTAIPNSPWLLVVTADSAEVLSGVNQLITILSFIFLGAIIIVIFVAIWMGRSIAKPVITITKILDKQSHLDFSEIDEKVYQKELSRSDEVGTMMHSLVEMVQNVRELLVGVTSSAEHVSATSEELTATANTTATSVEEVSKTVNEIAKDATSQAENTLQASSTLDKLSAEIEDNIIRMGTLASSSEDISKLVVDGIEVLQNLSSKTDENQHASKEVYDSIVKTNESSAKIGEASNLITSISEQTNLLALNASIEAARAGEHGRGFAVVADEIRQLAEQSRSTTSIIDQMVENLVYNAKVAVEKVELSNEIVENQKGSVSRTRETFENISQAIEKSEVLVSEISDASVQMEREKREVINNLEALSEIAQQNAASTQEVSASLDVQATGANEIALASEDLSNMSQELQEMISKFKV